MTVPQGPPRRTGPATASLILGIVAVVGALLIGIRFSGYNAILFGAVAVLVGGVAVVLGIVALILGARRSAGRSVLVPSIVGIVLGNLVIVALFVGRHLGEEYLGFPYPG